MGLVRKNNLLFVFILCCICLESDSATDTITSFQPISDPGYIISNGSSFRLGFFSPVDSTSRFLGIWYNNISVTNVVWVANRDKPLQDSSGVLNISADGLLVLLNGQKEVIWSAEVTTSVPNSSAQLLDTGNLVLIKNTTKTIIWQSFQLPCDTLLPKMNISTNLTTGNKVQLTSWKSLSDPSNGSFLVGIQPLDLRQVFIWKDGSSYWRSGPWNGQVFIGIQTTNNSGLSLVNDREGTASLSFSDVNNSLLHFHLNTQGSMEQRSWDHVKGDWEVMWATLQSDCDVYGKCGAFGICNSESSPICSCLNGFEPNNTEEWNRGNWTGGCVRSTPLQCERVAAGGEAGKMDWFQTMNMIKVPDFADFSSVSEADCKQQCLQNCSCTAYAFDSGTGCMSWTGRLIDAQKFSSSGVDLNVRVANTKLETKQDVKKIVTITVIVGTVSSAICTYCGARKKKGKGFLKGKSHIPFPSDNLNQAEVQELPLFTFEKLESATNNFHLSHKLGQGGFGPVYRGKLSDGQEIAVKRLSRTSAQGLEEFMNEVVVISKLQHRNLVRLLGCCVEGEERMLIYEYMPNKSLDAFLFDPHKEKLLDWSKRFNIIEGIGRGLLYLHRDSRLRIIHRDLKASNILLDKDLNPKISDFGMARIFGNNEDQANTKKVVGTYGYMSPEYAMKGRFSKKSAVFSFGVLLLEIVSGRKNTSFYHDDQFLNLLGLAWQLWNADNTIALIDPMVYEPHFEMEILRCIQVGLLCVQEFAQDRPTISVVVSMLKSEIFDMPRPKKPAFTEKQIALDTNSSQRIQTKCSVNNVTITMVQGR